MIKFKNKKLLEMWIFKLIFWINMALKNTLKIKQCKFLQKGLRNLKTLLMIKERKNPLIQVKQARKKFMFRFPEITITNRWWTISSPCKWCRGQCACRFSSLNPWWLCFHSKWCNNRWCLNKWCPCNNKICSTKIIRLNKWSRCFWNK